MTEGSMAEKEILKLNRQGNDVNSAQLFLSGAKLQQLKIE